MWPEVIASLYNLHLMYHSSHSCHAGWGGKAFYFLCIIHPLLCSWHLKSLSVLNRNAHTVHLTVVFLLGQREPRDLKALFTRQLQVWIWSLSSNWGFRTENDQLAGFFKGQTEFIINITCVHAVVAKIKSWHRSFSEIWRRNACVPLRGIRM